MPQVIEYYAIAGKRWEWHLVLWKEWLREVEGGTSDRKYTKWLRTRKVFDRAFIELSERLLGIDHPRKARPRLNEVGEELLEELAKSEKKAQDAQQRALERGPGRDMPRPAAAAAPPPRRRGAPPPPVAEEPEAPAYEPPSAENDPFLRALLERFTELNPYLTMFVLKQIGEDFLSPAEVYRRVGTADFEGTRPAMPHFTQWLTWMEWLGGLKKVGFRYKATPPGAEIGAYLRELPLEELLEADEDDEPAPGEEDGEAPSATATPAAAAPAEAGDVAGEEGDEPDDDEQEEDDEEEDEDDERAFEGGDLDEDDLEDEGLDLPPEAEGDPEADVFWRTKPAASRPPSLAELSRDLVRLQESLGAPDGEGRADEPHPHGKNGEHAPAEATPAPAATREGAAAPATGPAATATEDAPRAEPVRAASAPPPASAARSATAAALGAPPATAAAPHAQPAAAATAPAPAQADPALAAELRAQLAEQAAALRAQLEQLEQQRRALEETQQQVRAQLAGTSGRFERPAPAIAPREALRLAVSWWLDGAAHEPLPEVSLEPHPSGKPLGLFRLLTLATLREAEAPAAEADRLFAALDELGLLENLLLGRAGLEDLLAAAAAAEAPAALQERLVHLVRYRRGLERLDPSALAQPDARTLGRTLRDEVTGATLGAGLVLVLRALATAGLAAARGLEQVAWLPSD